MKTDRAARDVFNMLGEVRVGTVVAVWRDGRVSVHRHLGFRYRTLPDGSREEPLTSFVKSSEVLSASAIQERIERAMGQRPADS